MRLREAMDQVVAYLIETRGLHSSPPEAEQLCDDLVMYVSKLLRTQDQEQRVGSVLQEMDERYWCRNEKVNS